jgi:hypothetical protein
MTSQTLKCEHCKNGWFDNQRYGCDVECINGILIDVDVAHEGWHRDVIYPLAPCHPDYAKPEHEQKNDCQERLAAWASNDP